MKALTACMLSGLVIGAAFASAEANIRQEQVRFEAGISGVTVTGEIKGYQGVDYQVSVRSGQRMVANFKPGNGSAYFNILPPGTDVALFVGSTSGNRFAEEVPADGVYTIRVCLTRTAARRNETARYTLEVSVADRNASSAAASPASGADFDRTLELLGIRFHVTCANHGSINTVQIVPAGLEIDNAPIVRTIDGTVTGAEVGDINADGSPEIYVYVTSAGSGSYGSLVAYSANRRRSLSEIYLPPVTRDASYAKGYRGHDEFAVLEGVLGRRFPVYRDADTNARPTGGMLQLQYKLVPGEAGWVLRVDKVVEY